MKLVMIIALSAFLVVSCAPFEDGLVFSEPNATKISNDNDFRQIFSGLTYRGSLLPYKTFKVKRDDDQIYSYFFMKADQSPIKCFAFLNINDNRSYIYGFFCTDFIGTNLPVKIELRIR